MDQLAIAAARATRLSVGGSANRFLSTSSKPRIERLFQVGHHAFRGAPTTTKPSVHGSFV
jgi:hypothetical protein